MSMLKVLTNTLVLAAQKNAYSADFSHFSSIEDKAADSISRLKGDVNLNGLTKLSTPIANALGKLRCSYLHLNGLSELSLGAAQGLSKFKGGLFLDGITKAFPDLAYLIANHSASFLGLNSLTVFPADFADIVLKALDQSKSNNQIRGCPVISLKGIKQLTPEVAKALSRYNGSLDLEGLVSLSEEVAKALASSKGQGLRLNGIKKLPSEIALAFSVYSGSLDFFGMKSISDSSAEGLSLRRGGSLNLGIKSINDSVARSLCKFEGNQLYLSEITKLSDESGSTLASHRSTTLNLTGLKSISDKVANAFARTGVNVYVVGNAAAALEKAKLSLRG